MPTSGIFNIFSFLENKQLAHWLNMTVNIALAILLFAMINRGVSIIVAEISRAQIQASGSRFPRGLGGEMQIPDQEIELAALVAFLLQP